MASKKNITHQKRCGGIEEQSITSDFDLERLAIGGHCIVSTILLGIEGASISLHRQGNELGVPCLCKCTTVNPDRAAIKFTG